MVGLLEGRHGRSGIGKALASFSSARTTVGSWLCYLQLGKKSRYSSMREQDYKPSGERSLKSPARKKRAEGVGRLVGRGEMGEKE